jgi:uncharacterized protein (DUF2147 family)
MAKLKLIMWDVAGRPIWAGSRRSIWGAPEQAAAHLSGGTAELTAVGLWEQVDDKTGSTQCWFEITERDGIYEGTIVRIFAPPDSTRTSYKRGETEGNGARFLGMTLITGMRRNGYSYENGTITDPRDGSRYRALMRLSSDGGKLEVRGYLGISLFGRSQIWNRLPDDALTAWPPAEIP